MQKYTVKGVEGRIIAMPKRSAEWNEGLSADLRDPDFAKEFILASLEEGLSLQVVLGKVIRAYGVKEFSKKVKIASPNILRAINPGHNATQETLNRLLKPFGLRLAVISLETKRTKAAG